MNKLKAAFIGFVPFGGTPDEIYAALESYAKIGYKAFESGDMLLRNGDPDENIARVKAFGMEPLSTGLGMGKLDLSVVPTVVEKAKKLGVNRAATFAGCVANHRFGMRPDVPGYDEVMAEIELLNAIAKELAKEGIVTSFHNHDAEFLTFYKGKCAFDYMVENSEYLKFEVDCGWALYGHNDPIAVLDKVGDKLCALHIKDFTYGNAVQTLAMPGMEIDENKAQNRMPRFTTPGTGLLPLAACLKKGIELGMDYAIVEQDFMYHMNQYDTLTGAYLNMKETGFVE